MATGSLTQPADQPVDPTDPNNIFSMTPEQLGAFQQTAKQRNLQTLGGEVGAAEKTAQDAQSGVGAAQKAGQAALVGARQNEGRSFAANQAAMHGGGTAGMGQAALTGSVAEGQIQGNTALQMAAAQKLADQEAQNASVAKTEYGNAQLKAAQEQGQYQQAGTALYDQLKQQYIAAQKDHWLMGVNNLAWVAQNPQLQAALKDPNPAVRAQANKFLADMGMSSPTSGEAVGGGLFGHENIKS